MAQIEYENGERASAEIKLLQRIETRLLEESESERKRKLIEDTRNLVFDNACRELKKHGISPVGLTREEIIRKAKICKEPERLAGLHRTFLEGLNITLADKHLIDPIKNSTPNRRLTHCYNCRKGLDNLVDLECSACNWIVCPNCGACGCGYSVIGSNS